MTKIIPTKFDNTKCRKCGCQIPYGTNVRWTKGEKGVTCVTCPGQVAGETELEAAQGEIARLRSALATSEEVRLASAAHVLSLFDEVTRLRSALAHELELAATRMQVNNNLRDRLATLANAPNESPEILDAILSEENSGEYEAVSTDGLIELDPPVEAYDDNCPI